MSERIEHLRKAVEKACVCEAYHAGSKPVVETFNGETVWEGVVEAFQLTGFSSAGRCYAFQFADDKGVQIKTVLHAGPVDSPEAAVKAAIADAARHTHK